jgi:hypothetical protein
VRGDTFRQLVVQLAGGGTANGEGRAA